MSPVGRPRGGTRAPAVMAVLRTLSGPGLLLLPGLLTVYLSFRAGGFFVGTPAVVAVALAVVLALRATLADDPLRGLGPAAAVAAGSFALYAAWVLASAGWSDAAGRAVAEFDRALLYLFALLLFASIPRAAASMRTVIAGLAAGICVVSLSGLVTRLLPEVFPTVETIQNRLAYPLTYWNGLGLLTAVGIVLCLHLASSEREPRVARVLGAAAVPALACTLLFTFSRAGIVAAALGAVVYLLAGRPRALPSALLSAGPLTALAVRTAYEADLLVEGSRSSAAAVAEGHEVALVVGACCLGAGVVRAILLRLDAPLARLRLPRRLRIPVLVSGVVILVAAAVATYVTQDVGEGVSRQYDRFVFEAAVRSVDDPRERLASPGNNGRLDFWRVSLEGFRDSPGHGQGAGTFRLLWERDRPNAVNVNDGHSLYLENLGELGLVGLSLLATTILAILVAATARIRGPDRALYAAAFATLLAWAVHASVDWDWELPAVTLWVFCLGGAVLARSGRAPRRLRRPTRVAIAIGLAALALTPGLAALSQGRLNAAVAALKRGECETAIDRALSSRSALGVRAEPYEVLGYCDIRLGATRLGVQAFEEAVERDPHNWEVHYGLALARAVDGRDPRAQARRALELNPREAAARRAVRRFRGTDRRKWRQGAVEAPIPLP